MVSLNSLEGGKKRQDATGVGTVTYVTKCWTRRIGSEHGKPQPLLENARRPHE